MSEDRPQRVRVTGPPRHVAARSPDRLGDVHEQTALGGVYLESLLREQLFLALRILLLVAVTVGALPLVYLVAPGLGDLRLFGLPLPWLLLGGAVYPFLLLLGWRYVRLAERNERDFADLVVGAPDERARSGARTGTVRESGGHGPGPEPARRADPSHDPSHAADDGPRP